jgi:hypothetical protein
MLRARSITTLGAVIALAAPAAAGAQQDSRSPDAADAQHQGRIVETQQQDQRAPDRMDAGPSASATPAAAVSIRATPPPASGVNGFEWGDAGIGAAGMLGVVGLVGGGVLLTMHRRRDERVSPSH